MNRSLLLLLTGTLSLAAIASACGDGPDPVPTPTTAPVSPTAAVVQPTATVDPNQPVGMSAAEFDALDDIQTSTTGIRFVDVVEGTGDSPTATQQVTIHYTGTLASDGTQFDSSVGRQPLTLGAGQFIPGFTEAILGMKQGGTRIVHIPAALAYGSTARSGIPANSDLIFEIELLAIE